VRLSRFAELPDRRQLATSFSAEVSASFIIYP